MVFAVLVIALTAVSPASAITGGTWYESTEWCTHPSYVDEDWPDTADHGLVLLEEAVVGIEPAPLPEEGLLGDLIGETGQTYQRFVDVGYGQAGVLVGGGPYTRNLEFIRKFSVQPPCGCSPCAQLVGSIRRLMAYSHLMV